jgi:hypothetical protein
MKPALLLARGSEFGPSMARALRVQVTGAVTCVSARRGLVAEKLLTAVEDETLELDVFGGEHLSAWLSRDNPFLTETQLSKLDERGVIRPGTLLGRDDVLASVLETELPRRGRVSRPDMVWVRDASWPGPAHWRDATVVECHILGRRDLGARVLHNLRQRIRVRLHLEHPLSIGDVLLCLAGNDHDFPTDRGDDDPISNVLGVVGAILEDAQMPLGADGIRVDLLVPVAAAARRAGPLASMPLIGRAVASGAQFCQVRAMGGSYSLITQQPLGGKWGTTGQEVSVAQLGWLRSRGMQANIGELVGLKSDDVRHRARLDTLRRTGKLVPEAVPAPGMPETLNIVRSELMALGLVVTLEDAQAAVALTLRPAANEEIVAGSRGEIRRPETLDYKTLLDIEGGLFCPKVFGGDDHARRQRWGHVKLPAPVVSPLWRFGSPSILERLLGWRKEQVDALLNHEIWVHEVDGVWHTAALPLLTKESKGREPEPKAGQFTGASAVAAMLKTVPPEQVPPGLRGQAARLALRVVPVLPPDIRPLVLLDNGNFATADVNDLYRRLINCSNALAKLEDLQAPWPILWHQRRQLQRDADALWANCLAPHGLAVLGASNRPLLDCLELIVRRLLKEDSKRVEWCASARAVALPDVAEHRLLVPQDVFATLLLNAAQPLLVTAVNGDGTFVALLPEPHEQPVIAMSPLAYQRLGLDGASRHACVVHRPLGVPACAEARRLLDGDPGACGQPGSGMNWTNATEFDAMVAGLVAAALNEQRVVLDSPRGMLLAGTGCVDLRADTEAPIVPAPAREVPRPAEQTPLTGAALRDRIGEALESYKRQACIFHLTRSDEEPAVGVGHVGGLPDLPPGVEWPRGRDHTLPFLAQLPLDAGRVAGLLPIDVAPGSLLTIFETPPDEAASNAVFIVSTNAKLERRRPPPGVLTYPWCLLESEIVAELPVWEETVALLKAELGPIAANDLRQFHDREWSKHSGPANTIKLGGWPAWIQACENDTPLLAQIVSTDAAQMCFVDEGSLYVFASGDDGYEVVLQYC